MIEWLPTVVAFVASYLVAALLPRDWTFVQKLVVAAPAGIAWAVFARLALTP